MYVQALQNLIWDPTGHDHPERPLASTALIQTLPKLHLAPYKNNSLLISRAAPLSTNKLNTFVV